MVFPKASKEWATIGQYYLWVLMSQGNGASRQVFKGKGMEYKIDGEDHHNF